MKIDINERYSRFLKSLPLDHREKIDFYINNADKVYREIFINNLKYIKIKSITGVKLFFMKFKTEGMSIPKKIPYIGGIYLDTTKGKKIIINGNKIPQWYETLFHEIGHGVDYYTKNDKELKMYLRKDLNVYLDKLVSYGKYDNYSILEKNLAVDILIKKRKPLFFHKNTKINEIINNLKKDSKKQLARDKKGDVSDLYGIMTNNKICGNYFHSKYYETQLKMLIFSDAAKMEFFAHNFANGMLNNFEKMEIQRKYFPHSNEAINKLMKNIYMDIKKIRTQKNKYMIQ